MLTMSAASLEYVQANITASKQGAAYNPTADNVQFAFVAPGESLIGAQWLTGSWDGTTPRTSGVYVCQCLVGPGGTTQLAPGIYDYAIKITDSPEVPVLPVGRIQIV